MVTWAQREPGKVYPAWWEDPQKLTARRLREMNYAHVLGEKDGLPPGMTIKRNAAEFKVWIDGREAYRQQFTNDVKAAADKLAAWIEEYRKESEDIMGVSALGLGLLKDLAATHGTGLLRTEINVHGGAIAALARKSLIKAKGDRVYITEAGMSELLGLPEFDEPTSPPAKEQTSPPTPLRKEERGEEQGSPEATVRELADAAAELGAALQQAVNGSAQVDAALDEVSRAYFDEQRLVRVIMADGIGLAAVVKHCGSEITSMGGTVIKLEMTEALLREVYPPLVKYLEGLDAIGAEYAVFGDVQIVVERPLEKANEPIPFGLT